MNPTLTILLYSLNKENRKQSILSNLHLQCMTIISFFVILSFLFFTNFFISSTIMWVIFLGCKILFKNTYFHQGNGGKYIAVSRNVKRFSSTHHKKKVHTDEVFDVMS